MPKTVKGKRSMGGLVGTWVSLIIMAAGCRAVQPMVEEAPVAPEGPGTIMIAGGELNPRLLAISPGSAVTWVVTDWPVEITLLTTARLCGPPKGFRRTEEGIYLSGILQAGSRVSLCFAEPGTYDYEVFTRGRGAARKNEIALRFNRTLIGQIQVR